MSKKNPHMTAGKKGRPSHKRFPKSRRKAKS